MAVHSSPLDLHEHALVLQPVLHEYFILLTIRLGLLGFHLGLVLNRYQKFSHQKLLVLNLLLLQATFEFGNILLTSDCKGFQMLEEAKTTYRHFFWIQLISENV